MATIAKPSRAIPSRALVERARPSRAERERPTSLFYLDADLIDRVTHQSMDVSLLAENGKYVERFGEWVKFGADQARLNGEALALSGEYTNKTECRQINPSDTTNVAASSSTITIEDEGDSLASAGGRVFGANVFQISAVISGEDTRIGGVTGNTNPHSFFVFGRVVQGSADLKLSSGGNTPIGSEWGMVEVENYTPLATDLLRIRSTSPNTIVQFVIPQLTETKRNMDPAGNEEVGPVMFASEEGNTDNGIKVDLDIFTEIKALLQSGEGHIHWEGSFGFDKGDNSSTIALLATTNTAPFDILYINTSGDFKSYDGTTVAGVTTPNYLAGDPLEVDIYYSYITNKFRVDVTHNGTTYTGTEAVFGGWALLHGEITQMWGDLDGLSVKLGPEQSYIEGVA